MERWFFAKRWMGGKRGISLIETLIALGILSLIGVAFMSGLSTAFRAQDITRERVRAENLARAQLEDIRHQPYQASYTVSVPLPRDYSITIDTQPYEADNNIQKNTVTVSRAGKALVRIEDLKVRR